MYVDLLSEMKKSTTKLNIYVSEILHKMLFRLLDEN